MNYLHSIKIGSVELNNNVFLAPMAGISDMPFRVLCKEFGAGLVYTEMVSSKGMFYDDTKTKKLMEISEAERPVAVQIFGSDAKIMADIKAPGNLEYLGKTAMPMLIKGAYQAGYKPVASPEDIGLYVSASYTGIEKFCIMSHCYGTGDPNIKADPKKLFRTLADTIIVLLGGKING